LSPALPVTGGTIGGRAGGAPVIMRSNVSKGMRSAGTKYHRSSGVSHQMLAIALRKVNARARRKVYLGATETATPGE